MRAQIANLIVPGCTLLHQLSPKKSASPPNRFLYVVARQDTIVGLRSLERSSHWEFD